MSSQEKEITLGILNAVHQDSRITQRSVSKELGIALGLTNSYLKRCIKKGLIKIQYAPANRYAYYLTPHGLAEKSRLAAEYLSQSFGFYRQTQAQCSRIIEHCEVNNWKKVGLHGLTDIAEITILCAANSAVSIVGVIDPVTPRKRYANIPIFRSLEDLGSIDAILIADIGNPQATYDKMRKYFSEEHILFPETLDIDQRPRRSETDF